MRRFFCFTENNDWGNAIVDLHYFHICLRECISYWNVFFAIKSSYDIHPIHMLKQRIYIIRFHSIQLFYDIFPPNVCLFLSGKEGRNEGVDLPETPDQIFTVWHYIKSFSFIACFVFEAFPLLFSVISSLAFPNAWLVPSIIIAQQHCVFTSLLPPIRIKRDWIFPMSQLYFEYLEIWLEQLTSQNSFHVPYVNVYLWVIFFASFLFYRNEINKLKLRIAWKL